MPFFLPKCLIELRYLTGENDSEYERFAKDYHNDIDLAFFVVNFGYTKADYESLTPREKAFILKAWEDKQVLDSTLAYQAAFTAYYNCNRPKRKKAIKLWQKRTKQADAQIVDNNLLAVRQAEQKDGNGWIKRVFAANGLKLQERRE